MKKTIHVFYTNQDELIDINDDNFDAFAMHVADYIKEQYQKQLVRKIIKDQYSFLEKDEQMFILGVVEEHFDSKQHVQMVREILQSLVQSGNVINIQGMVRFRMRKYLELLEDAVESAVNSYIINFEYNQLIECLQMYVEMQTPLAEEIHVSVNDAKYYIKDKNGKEIFSLTDFEDTMLDVIITLAPQTICIHNIEDFENKQLLKTILKIFHNRVRVFRKTNIKDQKTHSKFNKE